LLHISEIDWSRLESMDGVYEVGDTVKVKLIEIDRKTGKFRLSRKALLPKPEGAYEGDQPRQGGHGRRQGGEHRGPRRDGGDRGPRRDGGDRGPRRDHEHRGP